MTWAAEFLDRCLDGLPRDKYRARAKAELEDHLLTLAEELEASGNTPEQAQIQALSLMGDPEQLNPSFRAEWVRRASSWKYCLRTAVTSAFHTYAVNLLFRWFVLMPPLLLGKGILFAWLESDSPIPFTVFSMLNFLPGIWFAARELSESFSIHPQRRIIVFIGLLSAWFLELGPFLGSVIALPFVFITPLIFAGHFPLILLAWESQFHLGLYGMVTFLICLSFALFYRPKSNKPFLQPDKD